MTRNRRVSCSAALLVAACLLAPVTARAQDDEPKSDTFRVRAYVGGLTSLRISGDLVQWLHRAGERPGRDAEGVADPELLATVNGQAWEPGWIGMISTRVSVPAALPDDLTGVQVYVRPIQVRGAITARQSETAVVVAIDDVKLDGGDWYEFEVTAAPKAGAAPTGDGVIAAEFQADPTSQAPDPDADMDFRVSMEADREARAAAQQGLAGEYRNVQEAWAKAGDAGAEAQRLQVLYQSARQEVAYWNQQVAEAEEKVKEQQRSSRTVHGVTYDMSSRDYWYRVWRARLDERRASQRQAQEKLAEIEANLTQTAHAHKAGTAELQAQQHDYQVAFDQAYQKEFAQRKEHIGDEAQQQADQRKAEVASDTADRHVPGTYSLIHNGKDIGQTTLFADHSMTTIAGERRHDYQWSLTDEGLLLRLRDVEWLMKPVGDGSWLGSCIGGSLEEMGRNAMLKPAEK